MSQPSNIAALMTKLNEYVEWFEGDDFALEQAVDKYTEAQKLAAEIQQNLDNFKNQINIVKKQFDKE